jgi:TP901 family phage tail tape measure protein
MAQGFNLTAQLNLVGPTNVRQIASQIRRDLGTVDATVNFKLDPAATKNVTALNTALKQLNTTLNATNTSATSAANAIKNLSSSINSVKANNLSKQLNSAAKATSNLNKSNNKIQSSIAGASNEMQEFGKQAGLAVRRFTAFATVTSVIYGLTNSINRGVQAFIDYDKELVRLQQVTGQSLKGLSSLQSAITNLATSLGVGSKELTTVAVTLAQAGLSAKDTEKSLKALALSSLAPSFDNMNETVEGSIALMRQFGIGAVDLEKALGSVNAVAAKFAVEASDIITAIQRTGGVFATASRGVSEGTDALNEFIAVFTSVRATTRESAETIATGLRTIFTRIQRGDTIDALKEFGVNLTDAQGKFVGAYKAVELLSKGLNSIDPRDLKFSQIVEELGGFRQIGKVIPLIQQFATAQQALAVAQQGQGSLAEDAATGQKSLANQISKVKEQFFALFREIGQSQGFQTLAKGALNLASALIKILDATKSLLPALSVVLAFKGSKALTEFVGGLGRGFRRGPDNKAGAGKNEPFARGGVVKKFARGGVVPGSGNRDTVPAMLTPGEFVIRKKAVETIGADNLHNMNKYGTGGSIRKGTSNRRRKFAKGGKAAKLASIDGDFRAVDGDTFDATVTPTGDQFTARFRVAEFDTYEGRGKASLVSADKAKKIMSLNKGKPPLEESSGRYKVPKDYKVTKNDTAATAAQEAKKELQSKLDQFVGPEAAKKTVPGGGGVGRYLAKTGFSMPDSLTTGRKWDEKGKELLNVGGVVKKFMAGGKAPEVVFGTGQTKFPKRITNAYAKELQKKLDSERVNNAFDPYPTNERITIDPAEVQQKFQGEPFDRKRFLSLFNTKVSRNELIGNLSDFAKFIGLPGEDLSKILPQTIDFGGELQRYGNRGTFSRDPFSTQGYDTKGLEAYGFTAADEQDLFGYQKLIDEKTKEIKKIIKTPIETFEDGSFSYDSAAFLKATSEKDELSKKLSAVMDKRAVARKALMEQKKSILASTGRGFVSLASNAFERNQPKNVLYHELTHQLFNSLRAKSEDSFAKYKERVSQLFGGDNDDLADAFDALGGSYNSADVVYGRSYKNGLLDTVLQNLRQGTINSGGRSANPELSKEAYSMWVESGQKKNAREYRPINPKINEILLKGGQRQDTIDKVEDYGKEEFLTTLIQNAPKLDSNMQGILDSTLNELLGNAGIQRQTYAGGGKVMRNLGYIDFDVINDPANAKTVEKAMKEAGVDGPRKYTEYLMDLATKARKNTSIQKLTALYGVAGAGKSSIAMGRGANDIGTLRQTNRFPILTPEDISKASEVMLLSSTVSQDKLEGMFKEADKIYGLSTTTQEEKDRVRKQRTMRDVSGIGLFGREAGSTTGAPTDTAKEEALLMDRFGDKTTILGRGDSNRLRRKKGNELVEITKKKLAFTWGGFAPTTAGHESIMEAAKAAGIPYEDFIALVGANEGIDAKSYRTAVFDQDFRLALAKAGFGSKGASVLPKAFGDMSVPLAFDMGEKGGRRQITLAGEGSMAFVADKTEQQMEKYKKAGYGVTNLERTGGISGTQVRDLLLNGDLEGLQKIVSPGVFSLLKDNISQLQNRANVLPVLIEQAEAAYKQEVAAIDEQLAATGITRANNKKAETDPEYAEQLKLYQSLKEKKKKLETKKSFEPYRLLRQLADSDPAKYGLRFDTVSSAVSGPSSAMQQAILEKVAKQTAVKKSSGILPAEGREILKRFGADRLPTDPMFGPFAGKTVRDTAEGGKLKYWNSAFRPETKADKLAYYTATRDYLIDKFNESQGSQRATALKDTTNAVLSSAQLGLVGLNPLGYTGLLGPETWNLGTDPSGQERSIDASIVQRGLPRQYQNVIDYLSGETEQLVGGAAKLLGINPKKLTQKQRETLGQGNIEGALLEQIFGSADATILDDALRTRPIDFPSGIGPKAASIFGIDPDIPTEVKRTIDSGSRAKAVEEFQRYFRQQYGIPDPDKQKVQALADGGAVKLYHGSNTGIDDNVLKNFKEKGALSNIATGYGQGAGFYLYTEKNKAEQQAKMRVNGGSGFTLASGDRSGKPMVLSFNEVLDPKTFDLDYELQKKLVVQWIHDNYDLLKDKYAPSETQTGLKDKFDKNPDAGMMSVGIRVQEGSQTLKSEDGAEFEVKGGARKSIYAGSEGDVREGALLGQLMSRIQAGDPDLVQQFESGLFKHPLGLALKYVGSTPLKPTNIETFATGGRAGISPKDTVPALLTPGEFVINKQAAQKIGYGKLNQLNKADKVKGYNKGGAVGAVQRLALGGSVDPNSIIRQLGDWIMATSKENQITKFDTRPSNISRSTTATSKDVNEDLESIVKSLNDLGYSAAESATLIKKLRNTSEISYKELEKALSKDIANLKALGAGFDTIIQAETALAKIREKGQSQVDLKKNLEGAFGQRGNVSDKLLGGKLNIGDIGGGSAAAQTAIERQAEYLIKQRTSSLKSAGKEVDLAKITEQAYVKATSKVSGIDSKAFKSYGISGKDIKNYIDESKKNAKTLQELDQALLSQKLAELRNSAAYSAASRSEKARLEKDLRAETRREISVRRSLINDLAKRTGSKGVGATDMMDFNNSPILKALKSITLPGALMGASTAAGLIGGQGALIGKAMYGAKDDASQLQAAKTAVAVENAGVTISTGLATAAQIIQTVPGKAGLIAAAVVAIGSAIYAAADWFGDFSGKQQEAAIQKQKELMATRTEAAQRNLDLASTNLDRDPNNIGFINAFTDALNNINTINATNAVIDVKTAELDFKMNAPVDEKALWAGSENVDMGFLGLNKLGDTLGRWASQFLPEWTGMGAPKQKFGAPEMAKVSAQIASQNQGAANKALQTVTQAMMEQNVGRESILTGEKYQSQRTAVMMGDLDGVKMFNAMLVEAKNRAGGRELSEEEVIAVQKRATEEYIKNGSAVLESTIKSAEVAKAMEEADRAGRKLATSLNKMIDAIDQSINRIQAESQERAKASKQMIKAIGGEGGPASYTNRARSIIDNPMAYSEDEYKGAMKQVGDMVGGEQGRNLTGLVGIGANMSDAMYAGIVNKLGGKASTSKEEAAKEAIATGTEYINNLDVSDDVKKVLIEKLTANVNQIAEKMGEASFANNPQQAVDQFAAAVRDSSSALGDNLESKAKETAKALLALKDNALNEFAQGLQESSEYLRQAARLRIKADKIAYDANNDLREITTGVGESYGEAKGQLMKEVGSLTGGATDPAAIGKMIEDEAGKNRALNQKLQDAQNSGDVDAASKLIREIQESNDKLYNYNDALDKLADSTELYQKALDEARNIAGLQDQRKGFIEKLLTNTPEEADKLNQSFIRLQRNLSGGFNNPQNQRDARKAFNETYFKTGNVREAARAGNTVLANQRKETLALQQDPGFRAMRELNLRNQGASEADIKAMFAKEEANLMRQMAVESGYANNPAIMQAINSIENRNVDPAFQKASQQVLEAAGLRKAATEEQARVKETQALIANETATINLTNAVNNLSIVMQDAFARNMRVEGGRIPGPAGGKVPLNLGVGAPAAPKSKGGLIYAADGTYVNFEPKGTDTIPAMLSKGEYVVNAKSTKKNLSLLEAINGGKVNGMSKGGIVYLSTGGEPVKPASPKFKPDKGPRKPNEVEADTVPLLVIKNRDYPGSLTPEEQARVNSYVGFTNFTSNMPGQVWYVDPKTGQHRVKDAPKSRDLYGWDFHDASDPAWIKKKETLFKQAEARAESQLTQLTLQRGFMGKGSGPNKGNNRLVTPAAEPLSRMSNIIPQEDLNKMASIQRGINDGTYQPTVKDQDFLDSMEAKVKEQITPFNTMAGDYGQTMNYITDLRLKVSDISIKAGKDENSKIVPINLTDPRLDFARERIRKLKEEGREKEIPAYIDGLKKKMGYGRDINAPSSEIDPKFKGANSYSASWRQNRSVLFGKADYEWLDRVKEGDPEATAKFLDPQNNATANIGPAPTAPKVSDFKGSGGADAYREAQTKYKADLARWESGKAAVDSRSGTNKPGTMKYSEEELQAMREYLKYHGGPLTEHYPSNYDTYRLNNDPSVLGRRLYLMSRMTSGGMTVSERKEWELLRYNNPEGIRKWRKDIEEWRQTPQAKALDPRSGAGKKYPYSIPDESQAQKESRQRQLENRDRATTNGNKFTIEGGRSTQNSAPLVLPEPKEGFPITLPNIPENKAQQEQPEVKTNTGIVPSVIPQKPFSGKVWRLTTVGNNGEITTRNYRSKEAYLNAKKKQAEAKANGGLIYASLGQHIDFAPKGTDTIPAMLTPGEFVVNARATKENLPLLHAINDGKTNGMSKGGIVYLATGGDPSKPQGPKPPATKTKSKAPTKADVQKLERARTDAQQTSWMMSEAAGVAPDEVVNRSAASWTESQVGYGKWQTMSEQQRQEEIDKNKPVFQRKWDSYNARQNAAMEQSAREAGYENAKNDPNAGIVGANFFNTEKTRSMTEFDKAQADYEKARDAAIAAQEPMPNSSAPPMIGQSAYPNQAARDQAVQQKAEELARKEGITHPPVTTGEDGETVIGAVPRFEALPPLQKAFIALHKDNARKSNTETSVTQGKAEIEHDIQTMRSYVGAVDDKGNPLVKPEDAAKVNAILDKYDPNNPTAYAEELDQALQNNEPGSSGRTFNDIRTKALERNLDTTYQEAVQSKIPVAEQHIAGDAKAEAEAQRLMPGQTMAPTTKGGNNPTTWLYEPAGTMKPVDLDPKTKKAAEEAANTVFAQAEYGASGQLKARTDALAKVNSPDFDKLPKDEQEKIRKDAIANPPSEVTRAVEKEIKENMVREYSQKEYDKARAAGKSEEEANKARAKVERDLQQNNTATYSGFDSEYKLRTQPSHVYKPGTVGEQYKKTYDNILKRQVDEAQQQVATMAAQGENATFEFQGQQIPVQNLSTKNSMGRDTSGGASNARLRLDRYNTLTQTQANLDATINKARRDAADAEREIGSRTIGEKVGESLVGLGSELQGNFTYQSGAEKAKAKADAALAEAERRKQELLIGGGRGNVENVARKPQIQTILTPQENEAARQQTLEAANVADQAAISAATIGVGVATGGSSLAVQLVAGTATSAAGNIYAAEKGNISYEEAGRNVALEALGTVAGVALAPGVVKGARAAAAPVGDAATSATKRAGQRAADFVFPPRTRDVYDSIKPWELGPGPDARLSSPLDVPGRPGRIDLYDGKDFVRSIPQTRPDFSAMPSTSSNKPMKSGSRGNKLTNAEIKQINAEAAASSAKPINADLAQSQSKSKKIVPKRTPDQERAFSKYKADAMEQRRQRERNFRDYAYREADYSTVNYNYNQEYEDYLDSLGFYQWEYESDLMDLYKYKKNLKAPKRNLVSQPSSINEIRKAKYEQLKKRRTRDIIRKARADKTASPSLRKAPATLARGGVAYASNGALMSARSGTDTVPAMLTPGEFVVNREASQRHMPILEAINSGHFNRGGIVNYLANGGVVAPKYYAEGGNIPASSAKNSGGVSSNVAEVQNAISEQIQAQMGQMQSMYETAGAMMASMNTTTSNLVNGLTTTASSLQTYSTNISNISLPETITFQGNITSNHNFNGADAANHVLKDLGPTMKQQTNKQIKGAFDKVNKGVGNLDSGSLGVNTNGIIGGSTGNTA